MSLNTASNNASCGYSEVMPDSLVERIPSGCEANLNGTTAID